MQIPQHSAPINQPCLLSAVWLGPLSMDYLTQLERVDEDGKRLEKFVAALWTMVGGRKSH